MKRIILLYIAALWTSLFVWADEISFSDINILSDETASIGIDLTNQNTQYVSFQMDLYLPEGITLNKSGCALSNRFDQELVIGKQEDGAYRLTSTSFSLTPISGTSGRLLNLSVTISKDFVSGTIQIRNIRFATSNSERVIMNDISLPISITVAKFTVDDKSRIYGEDNPTFTYTMTEGELNGSPALSTTATKTSPVGTYEIVAARGTIVGRFEATNGTLTITKAPLTITANNFMMKQGDALPTFTASYSGFKNEETPAVLNSLPTFSCTATSASAPGTYDIIVGGGSASNYELSYVKGTLTITEADPVIVTAKSYTREYGDANPTFEYVAEGAALNGTPAITCQATETSPVGTYPIAVSKGSVTNYNDTYVNGTLTITKAPLTVTANNFTMKQGDALPTFTATYSGFKNNETTDVLSSFPIFSCAATSASAPGTYDIIVSGGSASNYEISYVKGTLTITEADPVTVTAKSYTRVYGESNPIFEYTTEGATLEGVPEIICEATATSPVGEYPIIISKGSVTNYNDTYVSGTLTITEAPLTITAKNYTIRYSKALPDFEAIYEGFKNNETADVLTKQPTFHCTASSSSEAGTYEIVVSGAEAENYDITYVNGTLTIVDETALNNIIACADIKAQCGQQVELPIKLTNEADLSIVGISFTLTLPDGVTVATDADGNPVYSLVSERLNPKRFTVYSVKYEDGSWGFRISTNNTAAVLAGTEGPVMTITLDINEGMEVGDYDISLTENKLSIRNADGIALSRAIRDSASNLTINSIIMGDVNGDGEVDLSDAIMVTYYSLHVIPANFVEAAADMNGDGEIDLSDAINIIYKSLGVRDN